MKKHTASLMTAAMLLTVAWMTGCDSGKVEQAAVDTSSAESAVETTAETVAETTADTEVSAVEADESVEFSTYDEFAAYMAEHHPELTMYAPPKTWAQDWETSYIILYDNAYVYQFRKAEAYSVTDLVTITVMYAYQNCESAASMIEQLGETVTSAPSPGYCFYEEEMTFPDGTSQMQSILAGITGDFNTLYTLKASHSDTDWNVTPYTEEELLSLREELRL